MSSRFPVRLAFLLALCLWLASPGCGSHEGAAAPTALTSSLRMAVLRARQKAAGYDFGRDASGTWRARAGGHGAPASVAATERGVRLEGESGFHLGVETTGVGRGTSRASLGVRGQRAEGQELVLDREDGVEERYLAGPLGVEQSWVVSARPAGWGPLSIEVAFDGLAPEMAEGATDRVLLRDERGAVRAGYRDLAAVDAEGRDLAARMEVRGAAVALVIDDTGAAYPLSIDPVVWSEQAVLSASDGAVGDEFGYSVAVDGGTAVVGTRFALVGSNMRQGEAYVFVQSGTTWTQEAQLVASDGAANDLFGSSVAVSGGTAVVGAPGRTVSNHSQQGTAYVFVQSGTTWTQEAELTTSDGWTADFFGASVAVSGGTALVAAPYHTVGNSTEQGSAYVFVQSGTAWTQAAELTSGDGATLDLFGSSVALSGDTAVVGAPGHTFGGHVSQGTAYVFAQSGATWAQVAELTAGAANDNFGAAVALSGGTLVVGAPNQTAGSTQGAAYVFVQSGATWPQQARLTAGAGEPNANFGSSVAVSGGTALVGANQYDDPNVPGAAYVFAQSGVTWTQQAELTSPQGVSGDAFGAPVAVSGPTAIVGAMISSIANPTKGMAYVFVASGNGGPCASSADCPSGNCVDGVCCDTSCGGGVATDCQSCLGAMTGGADGTCGTVTAGAKYTCRVATGPCDAAGVCPGSSTACPTDHAQPDGAPCDDGAACTQHDTCTSGVCAGTAYTCAAPDPCHVAGTCNGDGTCSFASKPDGTPCSGGTCLGGTCMSMGSSSSSSSGGTGGTGGAGGTGGGGMSTGSTSSSSGGVPEILPACACVPGSRAEQRGAPGGLAWSALALVLTSRRRRKRSTVRR